MGCMNMGGMMGTPKGMMGSPKGGWGPFGGPPNMMQGGKGWPSMPFPGGPMGPPWGGQWPMNHNMGAHGSMYPMYNQAMDATVGEILKQESQPAVAVLWNLDPDYTKSDLTRDLSAIDFVPVDVFALEEHEGAFGLVFSELYMAKAIGIALNGIDPKEVSLRRSADATELVRAAVWDEDEHDTTTIPKVIFEAVRIEMDSR